MTSILSELRRLNHLRTQGKWHIGHINEALDRGEIENSDGVIIASDCRRNDEPFICLSTNSMDNLLAVVDAADRFSIHGSSAYCRHSYQIMKEALAALDAEVGSDCLVLAPLQK